MVAMSTSPAKFFEPFKKLVKEGLLTKTPGVLREEYPHISSEYIRLCKMFYNQEKPWNDPEALLDLFEYMFILPEWNGRVTKFAHYELQRLSMLKVLHTEFPGKEFTGKAKEMMDYIDYLDAERFKVEEGG